MAHTSHRCCLSTGIRYDSFSNTINRFEFEVTVLSDLLNRHWPENIREERENPCNPINQDFLRFRAIYLCVAECKSQLLPFNSTGGRFRAIC